MTSNELIVKALLEMMGQFTEDQLKNAYTKAINDLDTGINLDEQTKTVYYSVLDACQEKAISMNVAL
jgi:hypothetical protein